MIQMANMINVDLHVYFCNFMAEVYLLQVYFQPDINIVELTYSRNKLAQ